MLADDLKLSSDDDDTQRVGDTRQPESQAFSKCFEDDISVLLTISLFLMAHNNSRSIIKNVVDFVNMRVRCSHMKQLNDPATWRKPVR